MSHTFRSCWAAAVLAACLVFNPMFSPSASAQASLPCSQQARDLINEMQAEVWVDVEEQEREHNEPLLDPLPNVSMISACVSLSWPSITFSLPSMELIIRGLARQLWRQACEAARNALRDAMPTLPTLPTLPGVPLGAAGGGAAGGAVPFGTFPAAGYESPAAAGVTSPYQIMGATGNWDDIKGLFEAPSPNPSPNPAQAQEGG